MRLLDLTLHNVGPFDDARIEFLTGEENEVPVTFITGENGAGKTIVLDAIRGLFGLEYGALTRSIVRPNVPFRAEMTLETDGSRRTVSSTSQSAAGAGDGGKFCFKTSDQWLAQLPGAVVRGPQACPPWIVDFWRSALPADSYVIRQLAPQDVRRFLLEALSGIQRNAAITELICYYDYMRSADEPKDQADGLLLYDLLKKIFQVSLLDGGEFKYVARRDLMPMISQSGQLVPLANLSSGNAYLAQHLINLLAKFYAVHVLRDTPSEELCMTPGLVLIDEAENHLHPRWQQRLVGAVREIFPNLQIIATTHSPFIVASVRGAKVFVCRYEQESKCCVIDEEPREYENEPIEKILLMPAFGETQPFGPEIAKLLEERKDAFEKGDEERKKKIEAELLDRNPNYFSYLDIERRLAALRRKAS